jgi:hypothetical protein
MTPGEDGTIRRSAQGEGRPRAAFVRGTRRAVACALAASAVAGCAAQRAGLAGVELRLEHYAGGLRYLELAEPAGARLLFDTGGGITLLAPAVAARAGCVAHARVTGFRMSGERIDFAGCGPTALAVATLGLEPDVAVFDLHELLPEGLPPIDGLASLQTFAGRVLTIDLRDGRLLVERDPGPARVRAMARLDLRLARGFAGAGLDAFVRVDGRDGPLWFELDSANLDDVLIARGALDQLALTAPQREGSPAAPPRRSTSRSPASEPSRSPRGPRS